MLAADGGDAEVVLERFRQAGIDLAALAQRLQDEGKESFSKSWRALLESIGGKSAQLGGAST